MSNRSRMLTAIVIGLVVIAAAAYGLMSGAPAKYLQQQRLDSQLALWRSRGLTSYEMKVHIGCFCPFFDRMPLTVQVRDGQVVSVLDSQGQPVATDDPIRMYGNEQLMTVDGAFEYARQAIRDADETRISYDSGLGFPASVNIDRIKLAIDDEMSVLISDVRALP